MPFEIKFELAIFLLYNMDAYTTMQIFKILNLFGMLLNEFSRFLIFGTFSPEVHSFLAPLYFPSV